MILSKLFITDAERLEAKAHFLSLKENDDWKFLVEKVIKVYKDELTEKLLSPETIWKYPEEQQEAKRLREHWIILSELPDELLKTLIEPKKDEEESDDPYFNKLPKV